MNLVGVVSWISRIKRKWSDVPEGGILTVIYVSLYCRIRSVILGNGFGNTGSEALVTGERLGRCGCKDCLYRVKGSWAMGVRS